MVQYVYFLFFPAFTTMNVVYAVTPHIDTSVNRAIDTHVNINPTMVTFAAFVFPHSLLTNSSRYVKGHQPHRQEQFMRHHLYSVLGKCEYCLKTNVYIVLNMYLTPSPNLLHCKMHKLKCFLYSGYHAWVEAGVTLYMQ